MQLNVCYNKNAIGVCIYADATCSFLFNIFYKFQDARLIAMSIIKWDSGIAEKMYPGMDLVFC